MYLALIPQSRNFSREQNKKKKRYKKVSMDRREVRGAKKNTIEWTAFWEGNEMDFELKKLLHEEDDMIRIDLSKKIDEKKSLPSIAS